MTYKEILKELGLFRLGKKSLRGGLMVFQYLKDSYRGGGGTPFTRTHSGRTRSNRYKMLHRKLPGYKKKIFTVRLPKEVLESTLPVIFKTYSDSLLDNLI